MFHMVSTTTARITVFSMKMIAPSRCWIYRGYKSGRSSWKRECSGGCHHGARYTGDTSQEDPHGKGSVREDATTVLDIQGIQVRKILMEKGVYGRENFVGWDIHMDSATHNIYVTCWGANSGVVCLSVEGELQWFSPLAWKHWGITEIHGVLCVTDTRERCLHLMSKTGSIGGRFWTGKEWRGSKKNIMTIVGRNCISACSVNI